MSKKTIGTILIESGKITSDQAERINRLQETENLRFGDAAVKLGFVSETDIKFAISEQFDFSYLSVEDSDIDRCLLSAFATEGPEIEEFKRLRSQLTLRWFEENKSLVICAPRAGCGTSYMSANLAVLFSQIGKKTLLVDANFRHPSQHRCFANPNKLGFSHVLADHLELSIIEPVTGLKNLHVLFNGVQPPNPVELLESSAFNREHKLLEENFDVVLYDAPPINEFPETQLLLSSVGGGIIVVKKGVTQVADLEKAKKKFEQVNATPVGAVMNQYTKKQRSR